jgi:hypothetical protein
MAMMKNISRCQMEHLDELTPWKEVCLEKPRIGQPLKKLPAFYGT